MNTNDKKNPAHLLLILKLVEQMRQAQKLYFQHRTPETLNKAKELERRVDYHLLQAFKQYGYPLGDLPTKNKNND